MGRYSLILVATLFLLLSYFVVSTSNTSKATIRRNMESFHYNNAKNVANSAAQLIIHNVINRTTGWVFDDRPNGTLTDRPLTDFADWDQLDGRYRIKEMIKGSDNLIVTVTGEVAGRQYDTTIHFKLISSITTLFDYAAYSRYNFSVYTNGYIDSFNSDFGTDFTGNAKVGYGPDGTFTNNGTINGTVSHKVEKDLPIYTDPGGGDPLVIPNTSMQIEAGEYRVAGDIDISGQTLIQIMGETVLYVEGDIKITGNAEIRIEPGASLTIYLSGELDSRGNGLTNGTGLAKNLLIFGTEDCTVKIDLQGSNNTTFTGAIYAPDAKILVRGGNNFTFRGSIIGRDIEIYRHLYYDESLADILVGSTHSISRYYVLSWQ